MHFCFKDSIATLFATSRTMYTSYYCLWYYSISSYRNVSETIDRLLDGKNYDKRLRPHFDGKHLYCGTVYYWCNHQVTLAEGHSICFSLQNKNLWIIHGGVCLLLFKGICWANHSAFSFFPHPRTSSSVINKNIFGVQPQERESGNIFDMFMSIKNVTF